MENDAVFLPVAAVRLGVSVATIQRLCHRGAMKFVRVGASMRIPKAELERVAREGAQYPDSKKFGLKAGTTGPGRSAK